MVSGSQFVTAPRAARAQWHGHVAGGRSRVVRAVAAAQHKLSAWASTKALPARISYPNGARTVEDAGLHDGVLDVRGWGVGSNAWPRRGEDLRKSSQTCMQLTDRHAAKGAH